MPIYEYRCSGCGEQFEKFMHASTTVACPRCDSSKVTRLLSLVGVKTGGSVMSSVPAGGGGCCGGGCGCH
jgi:putative FmdB family regulatory protein